MYVWRYFQQRYSRNPSKTFLVAIRNALTRYDSLFEIVQLQQPERSLHFIHLSIDAWSHDYCLTGKAEILEIVNSLFSFSVWSNDPPPFKRVECFCGMKAQYRKISVPQYRNAIL